MYFKGSFSILESFSTLFEMKKSNNFFAFGIKILNIANEFDPFEWNESST